VIRSRGRGRARRPSSVGCVLAVALAGCLVGVAAADETSALSGLVERASVGGSLRGGYWSSSRDLDGGINLPVAALWLHGRWDPLPAASFFLDGWVRNDDLFREEATSGKLREAYLDLRLGPLDLRIGRQIIAWGRADRINPTDNLTPRDFTLLVPEDADQRFGVTGVRATTTIAGLSLTGIFLPTFAPDVIPLRPPPALTTLEERVPGDPVWQGALKLERTGGRLDWSVSYYDGFDLFPDLQLASAGPSGASLLLTHHRIRVVGADAAAAVGPYTVRAEAAYTFTEHSRRGDQIKSPFFFMVVGADRTLPGAVYVNVQYALRVIADFQPPGAVVNPIFREVAVQQALINDQLDQVKHALALRVSRSWLNETLRAEFNAIVSPNRFDYALRPKVTYALTDRVKLTVGGDLFGGPNVSFFGRIRDASTAYVEARFDF
jgi:hypothetical protein